MCRYFCVSLLLLSLVATFGSAKVSESLRVKLPHGGSLIGRHLSSHSGRDIRAFMGIPYAEPPVGELRFKAPQPVAPWTGERRAVADGPTCIQMNFFIPNGPIEGEEDCLYLNVFVPDKPATKGPLPVLLWFHGGAFFCGAGTTLLYGPDFILDHDVILVSGNYRLGILGFMSTETDDCPGNFGFKDQVLTLRWVQENIAAFGGDPAQVTIFGESAGGGITSLLMLSPLAKGLFHRAISQSGSALAPWSTPVYKGVAASRAERVAELVGCPKGGNDWAKVMECVRKVPAGDITAALREFFVWDQDPLVSFTLVVESDSPGAFITKDPAEIQDYHGLSIPWMAGVTHDDGALKSSRLFGIKSLTNDLHKKWQFVLETSLWYDHHDAPTRKAITEKINQFYFNGNPKLSSETLQNMTNLYTDSWFMQGIDRILRKRLSKSKKSKAAPTFVYIFAHKGEASYNELFSGDDETDYGVVHGEDLQYIFPSNKFMSPSTIPTAEDHEVRRTMTSLWVNFAISGNPTPAGGEVSTKWEPAKKYPAKYLQIGTRGVGSGPLLRMEEGLMQDRADFWIKLSPYVEKYGEGKDEL